MRGTIGAIIFFLLPPLALAAGQLEMPGAAPEASFEGRVVDANGTPVAGAWLRASKVDRNSWGGATVMSWQPTETDKEGRFRVSGLSPGPIEIHVRAPGYRPKLQEILVPKEGEMATVEISLEVGAVLAGRVLDSKGLPVLNAEVNALGKALSWGKTLTDAEGRYQIADLGPGPHDVNAASVDGLTAYRSIEIQEGANRLDLTLPAGFGVSGRVTGRLAEPLAGASLVLYPSETGRVYQAESSSDGFFRFLVVEEGDYLLTVSREGFAPSVLEGLRVSASPVEGLELRLGPSVLIRGRLLGLAPEDHGKVQVEALSLKTRTAVNGAIDPEGNYRIPDVGPGEWQVTATVSDEVSTCRMIDIGAEDREVDLDLRLPTSPRLK